MTWHDDQKVQKKIELKFGEKFKKKFYQNNFTQFFLSSSFEKLNKNKSIQLFKMDIFSYKMSISNIFQLEQ